MKDNRVGPQTSGPGTHFAGGCSALSYTLRFGALQALDTELAIIIAAVDRVAAGYSLAHDDYSRLHQAHQFLIRILADLRGVAVTT